MQIVKNNLFSNIYEVDCFKKEFIKMTKEKWSVSPPFPRYQKWLIRRLEVLDKQGINALQLEGFEKLEDDKCEIYAIRYPHSKLNARVIYIYCDGGLILLLAAFKEKSSGDYKRGIHLAKKGLDY